MRYLARSPRPLGLALALFLASPLSARVVTWITNGPGNWSDTTNWNPPVVPDGTQDTAVIQIPGAVVTLDRTVILQYLSVGDQVVLQIPGRSLYCVGGGRVQGNQTQVQVTGYAVLQGSASDPIVFDAQVQLQGSSGISVINVVFQGSTDISAQRVEFTRVRNEGTLTWTGRYWRTEEVENLGTVYVRGDTVFIPFANDFVNSGTVEKDGGPDTTLFQRGGNFSNASLASLVATWGTLWIPETYAGGTFSGTIKAWGNGRIVFQWGKVFEGVLFLGDGEIRLEKWSHVFRNTLSIVDSGVRLVLADQAGLDLYTTLWVRGQMIVQSGKIREMGTDGAANLWVTGEVRFAPGDDTTEINLDCDVDLYGQMVWESGNLLSEDDQDTVFVRSPQSLILGTTPLASLWRGRSGSFAVIVNEADSGVQKPNLATTVTVELPLINHSPGGVQVKGGTLTLVRTASYDGVWQVDSGAVLRIGDNLPGGRFWGEFQGKGTVRAVWPMYFDTLATSIRPGIVFQESSTVYVHGTLSVDPGAQYWKTFLPTDTYVYGGLAVAGLLQWNQGTFTGPDTVEIHVEPQGRVVVEDTATKVLAVPLNLFGEMEINNATLRAYPQDTLWNSGTLRLRGEATLALQTYAPPHLQNLGTVVCENDSGYKYIQWYLHNESLVQVRGAMQLYGGSHTGEFEVTSGGYLSFIGTDSLKGAVFRGDTGTVFLSGTWILVPPLSQDTAAVFRGGLTFRMDGGTIQGGALALVNGARMEFLSGSLENLGVSAGRLWVGSGATLAFTGGDIKDLRNDAQIYNAGTMTWDSGTVNLAGAGSWIENHGTFAMAPDSGVTLSLEGNGRVSNWGTWTLQGLGAVEVSVGRRNEWNSLLWVQSGTLRFLPTSHSALEGELRVTDGLFHLDGGTDTLIHAQITGPLDPLGEGMKISGASTVIDGKATIQGSAYLEFAGTNLVGDTLQVDQGTLAWTGGHLRAPVVVEPGGLMGVYGANPKYLHQDLWVKGRLEWQKGEISIEADSVYLVVDSGGTFALRDSGIAVTTSFPGSAGVVVLGGGLLETRGTTRAAGPPRILSPVWVEQQGRLRARGLPLVLAGGGVFAGEVVAGDQEILFASTASTPDTFAGLVLRDSATVVLEGWEVLEDPSPFSDTLALMLMGPTASLVLSAQRVSGGGILIQQGTAEWISGDLGPDLDLINEDTLWLAPDPAVGTSLTLDSASIFNFGTLRWTLGALLLKNQATVTNDTSGVMRLEQGLLGEPTGMAKDEPLSDPPVTFKNFGTLRVDIVDTVVFQDLQVVDSGEVQVQSGTLQYDAPSPRAAYSGTFHLTGGSVIFNDAPYVFGEGLRFAAARRTPKRLLRTPGLRPMWARQSSAQVVLSNGTTYVAGTVTVDPGVTVELNRHALKFGPPSHLELYGTLNWRGGAIVDTSTTGLGSIRIHPGGRLDIQTEASTPESLRVKILNEGVVQWDSTAGNLYTGYASASSIYTLFLNEPPGTLAVYAPAQLVDLQASTRIINRGVLRFDVGTSASWDPWMDLEGGLLEIASGSVTFGNDVAQDAGVTRLLLGTRLLSDTFFLTGGTLEGKGTLWTVFVVDSVGRVSPGLSTGSLVFFDEYLQFEGTLDIEIAGTDPQHDQLLLRYPPTLGGALNVSLLNGYTPQGGERFAILKYSTAGFPNGDFDTKNLPPLSGGKRFLTEITDTAYLLKVVSPPVAVLDTFTIDEDQSLTLFPLANDYDPDGDSIFIASLLTQGTEGTPVLLADGSVTYTPAPDSFGVDTFRYILQDTTGLADTGLVRITIRAVNDTPRVSFAPLGNQLVFNEDDTATLDLDDYVEDPDHRDADLTWTWQIGSLRGPVTPAKESNRTPAFAASPRGTWLTPSASTLSPFRPAPGPKVDRVGNLYISVDPVTHVATFWANPDYNNPAGIPVTFTATDPEGAADSDQLTVIIQPVPDPPRAVDDTAQTQQGTPVAISVLDNDSDPDGDPLTVVSVSTPAHGTAAINPGGTITYTPDANFTGQDAFTYTVSDGQYQDPATVTVTVLSANAPPQAQNDTAETDEDTPVTISVLDNDSDPDGDPLTVVSVSTPAHGTAAINPGGTITYTPNANYFGPDTFTYAVSDGQAQDTATVAVTVRSVNDPPVVSGMPDVTFPEDSSYTLPLSPYVSDPDHLPEEMTWTARVLNGRRASGAPSRLRPRGQALKLPASLFRAPGSNPRLLQDSLIVTIDPTTQTATFRGTPNYYADSLWVEFTATDPEGASDADTIRVTILPVNDPPTAPVRLQPMDGDTLQSSMPIGFLWHASSDVEGDSLTYRLRILILEAGDTLNDTLVATADTALQVDLSTLNLPGGVQTVSWAVEAHDGAAGTSSDWGLFYLKTDGLKVTESQNLPPGRVRFRLTGVRGAVRLAYHLVEPGRVRIRVYDAGGRTVGRHEEVRDAGTGAWTWSGDRSGIYFLRVEVRSLTGEKAWQKTFRFLYVR